MDVKNKNMIATVGFWFMLLTMILGIVTNGGLGTIRNFLHIPSFLVTFGGAFFAVMATADSLTDYLDGLKSFAVAYRKVETSPLVVAEQILQFSDIARKDGLLSLEEKSHEIENEYLEKGIRLIVDGTDPELVKNIMESELLHKEERDKKRVQFWQDLGSYGPAWGMLGTLLGLINMMKTMGSNVEAVGAGMSLALITTLYGSILANWISIPTARKLEKNSAQETLTMEIIVEGVLSIQGGENSRIIMEKIKSIMEMNEESQEE